jgi:hypothetical protein
MILDEYWLKCEKANTWFVALFMAGVGGILNAIANLQELCLNALSLGIVLDLAVSLFLIIASLIVRCYYDQQASRLLKTT